MAPQPKPPGQRRRRNAGQAQWRQLPEGGRLGKAPKLPGTRWLKGTREWWATIWASPMATAWEPADVDALVRLASMRDQVMRGEASSMVPSQMTVLEDRFGLNPKARRALQWEIASADGAEDVSAAPKKRHLRAVS